ncbi:flagellar basal body P-ring formation chaperone FlgA [Halocynthiibacter namhaensis]|uniref:flagellar basal body P-ring formation chaperone FlgA n=1 Tax=Halocynthiibacter namhaensis TaxID=1290553 RepID=UPI0005795F37|nr:flagellar basal body P-ring formation chaperone FlgA [Halocynthiibacter namhaensis]
MKLFTLTSVLFVITATPVMADTLVAARTIRSQTVLSSADFVIATGDTLGSLTQISDIQGLEARVTLYAGRPVRPGDVGPAAVINRNQVVPLVFNANGLVITTEGRALDRAAPGEYVRIMNLSSRTTVSGRAMPNGTVLIQY